MYNGVRTLPMFNICSFAKLWYCKSFGIRTVSTDVKASLHTRGHPTQKSIYEMSTYELFPVSASHIPLHSNILLEYTITVSFHKRKNRSEKKWWALTTKNQGGWLCVVFYVCSLPFKCQHIHHGSMWGDCRHIITVLYETALLQVMLHCILCYKN